MMMSNQIFCSGKWGMSWVGAVAGFLFNLFIEIKSAQLFRIRAKNNFNN
jgi:hypothetical protein